MRDDPCKAMKAFIGLLASANARPQRSEDSQAPGWARPAIEGQEASPGMGSPV
jgi:hypothetical protein